MSASAPHAVQRPTRRSAADRTPLPTIVGLAAGLLTLIAGVFLLAWLIAPPRPPEASNTVRVQTLLPPPDPGQPQPSPGPPQPAPSTPQPPMPSIPAVDLPAMAQALALPAVDADTVLASDWTPQAVTLPDFGTTTQAGNGDRPAQRLPISADLLARFYPRGALRRGIEGRTDIRLHIAADGSVTDVEVLDSEPAGIFEEAARRAAQQVPYLPAIRGGEAVASTVRTHIDWTVPR